MTNLREAAQMALDALLQSETNPLTQPELTVQEDAAIEALRAALANEFNPDWDQVEALQESLREHMAEIQRLRAALAQQEQEPVAWIYSHKGQKSVSMNYVAGVRAGPLYASPLQAWGTVSDSQLIDEVRRRGFVIRDAKIGKKWIGLGSDDFNDFNPYFKAEEAARWAEEKLKEKNYE